MWTLNNVENLHLVNEGLVIKAPEITREEATGTIWICYTLSACFIHYKKWVQRERCRLLKYLSRLTLLRTLLHCCPSFNRSSINLYELVIKLVHIINKNSHSFYCKIWHYDLLEAHWGKSSLKNWTWRFTSSSEFLILAPQLLYTKER